MASSRRHAVDGFFLRNRRQSFSARNWTRDAVAATDCAGRCLGRRTAGVDAFARQVVFKRLPVLHAGTVVTDAATALSRRAGKDAGALDSRRGSTGVGCAARWIAV